MRRAVALIALLAIAAAVAACVPGTTSSVPPKVPSTPRKEGAILLASPGKNTIAYGLSGSPREVVRGRVRWHLESDGTATRLRSVSKEPINVALTLPPWLGNGVVLASESGLSLVEDGGTLRALLRAPITSPSVGAHELWACARNTTNPDWVRIDPSSGKATWSEPPIAAPLLSTWSSSGSGPLIGRATTTGPEYLSPKVAVALVDLLGPITTRDGGETWGPLPRAAVDAAFPNVIGPTRIVREPSGILLGDELRLVPLSPTGQLGAPIALAKNREVAPDVTSIRIETALLQGVPLEGGNVLVADGGRFAIASLDPVRVLRVTRASDLTHCELHAEPATKDALAVAVCVRHDEGPTSSGVQLVVGVVLEGPAGLHFVPERIFPAPTQRARSTFGFSADGALVVGAPCTGSEPVVDVVHAPKVCVRAAGGVFHESTLGGVAGRVAIAPRLDGGVLLVRFAASSMELAAMPPDATSTTTPLRLGIDSEAVPLHRELATCAPSSEAPPGTCALSELSAGKFVFWRKVEKALEPLSIELSLGKLSVRRGQALPLGSSLYGISGAHALVVSAKATKLADGLGKTPGGTRVDLVRMTSDAGISWAKADWPETATPLDEGVECGALGCLIFGWSRVGWQRAVASVDEVVTLDAAPELPSPPPRLPPSSQIVAHCKLAGKPSPFEPTRVPLAAKPVAGKLPSIFGPEPKVSAGQTLLQLPFQRGAASGGVYVWGPTTGPWADLSRMFVRFSTDLDPLGATHETTPSATPFADRNALQRVAGDVHAVPLGPGRGFVWFCEFGHCDNLFFRAVAGNPLERVNLSAVGAITSIANARELGGMLLVVGSAIPREKITPVGKQMPEEQPFLALVSATGVVTTALARSLDGASATTDPVHGRFGVMVSSSLPSWLGGTTYVLPIDATGLPSAGFDRLVAAKSELAHPSDACSATSSGWDFGQVLKETQLYTLLVEIPGREPTTIASASAVIRSRLTASSACLDRWTQLGASDAFQLDPSSGHATLLSLAPDQKSATKTELSCTLEWTP